MTTTTQALRTFALRYPDVQEGVACEGTSLEKRTVKTQGKAFVFIGVGDAMVKLSESLPEAARLATREPAFLHVGDNGWVTATFSADGSKKLRLLEKWIDESYRAIVSKPPAKKPRKKRRNLLR